jgi:hypothetical protein
MVRRVTRRGVVPLLLAAVCCAGVAVAAVDRAIPDEPIVAEDFETPALDRRWAEIMSASPNRVTRVTSPVRSGQYALRLSVEDGDVAPLTATGNPRAQLSSRALQTEGNHTYIGWSTYFPSSFPRVIGRWFVFFQFHGAPYSGSPRIAFGIRGSRLGLHRDEAFRFDSPWSVPLQRERWLDFVVGVKWSRDPRVGYVELWFNGERQTFSNGEERLGMATIKKDQQAVVTIPANYRARGTVPGRVTIVHDDIEIGNSYGSVAR